MKSEDVSVTGSLPSGSDLLDEKPSTLNLQTYRKENVAVLRCQGRIVFRNEAAALSRRVTELMDDHRSLVLDLSGVEVIDSAGLGELVLLHMRAGTQDRDLRLAAPNGRIRHLLEITNLIAVFRVHATVDEAVYASRQYFAKSA
jgi:anti-sigma B factor antagonist